MWVLSEVKVLEHSQVLEHTSTLLPQTVAHTALRLTIHPEIWCKGPLFPLHLDLEVPGEFLAMGHFAS